MPITRTQVMMAERFAPELPWNNWDPERLGGVIMTFLRENDIYYRRWAQKFFENFQFYFGNQSLRWSRRYDFATDFDFLRQRAPSFYQKSQTNITRTSFEALCSEMFGTLPDWDVETINESSTLGKRLAAVNAALLDFHMQALSMGTEIAAGAAAFCMYGNYAAKTDWCQSIGQQIEIPIYEFGPEPMTGNLMVPSQLTGGLIEIPSDIPDSQGKSSVQNTWRPKLGPDGAPLTKKMFVGGVRTKVLTPFEYRRPIGSYSPHRDKYVQELSILDYDEWLDYSADIGGRTKYYYDIRPVYSDPQVYNFAVNHLFRMQMTTPPVFAELLNRQSPLFRSQIMRGKVFVVEHYDRPHPLKWPLGRRVIIANGRCTHITAPDYTLNNLAGWHPYTFGQWSHVPPASMASGPINDVVLKNKELNVYDSLVATSARRNMGSQLVFKQGAGFDPDKFTGEPGAMMEVQDPFAARWLHDDNPIPSVVPELRREAKEDGYETSGAGDSLRGQRSVGVSSGYQARQYTEREEKRLTLPKSNFEESVSDWGGKILACFRQNVVRLDAGMIGYLKRVSAGKFTVNDVYTLLGMPAQIGETVKVKKSSMAVKSKATQQATLQELVKGPVGQRVASSARVMDEYLKFFDVETFRDSSAVHRDRASRENEVFADMLTLGARADGIMNPVVLIEDDDDIHSEEHDLYYLQHFEEIRQNDYVHSEILIHREMHRLSAQVKQGVLDPQTAQMAAQAFVQARGQMPQSPVQVSQQNDAMRAAQAQQPPQPQQAPAPSQPAPGGSGGPPQTDPNAPSQNTPTGRNPATSGGSPQ